MHVPFSFVRCPCCGSTFEAAASIEPPDDFVPKTCFQRHHSEGHQPLSAARVLHSWKDISAYVGRGVRTVQRWEHHLGLPVHRAGDRERSAVIAFPEEIDDWLHRTPVGLHRTDADVGKDARVAC